MKTAAGEAWEGWRGAENSQPAVQARRSALHRRGVFLRLRYVAPTSNVKHEHDLDAYRSIQLQFYLHILNKSQLHVLFSTEQIRAAATSAPNGENPVAGGWAARQKENIILATVVDLHSCYRFST